MSGKDERPSAQTTIFRSNPELFEYLNNVIQDAQASGSIVHVITILPAHIEELDENGVATIKGCAPGARHCPK